MVAKSSLIYVTLLALLTLGCSPRSLKSHRTPAQGSPDGTRTTEDLPNLVPPSILTQPNSVATGLNGQATFNVSASGEELNYQWQMWNPESLSFEDLEGQQGPTLTLNTEGLTAGAKEIRVVVENRGGEAISNVVYLELHPPPTILGNLLDRRATDGSDVSLQVLTQDIDDLNYQWQFRRSDETDFTNLIGQRYRVLIFNPISEENEGHYRVLIQDRFKQTTTSAEALLQVDPPPSPVATTPAPPPQQQLRQYPYTIAVRDWYTSYSSHTPNSYCATYLSGSSCLSVTSSGYSVIEGHISQAVSCGSSVALQSMLRFFPQAAITITCMRLE